MGQSRRRIDARYGIATMPRAMVLKAHHVSSAPPPTDAELTAHLRIARYGPFTLTDAIRPMPGPSLVPVQGYRRATYPDQASGKMLPCLIASASREILLDLFLELVDLLGAESQVSLALETSHTLAASDDRRHFDHYRTEIDHCVAKSHLVEYEDVLLEDGCAGVAVYRGTRSGKFREIQLDEHKLLILYGNGLARFEAVLEEAGVRRDDGIRFISEVEHCHQSTPELERRFWELHQLVGAAGG